MDSKNQNVIAIGLPVVDVESLCKTALHYPIVCFFLTAPLDYPNRGDTDYVSSLVDGINQLSDKSVYPIHVTGNNTINGKRLYDYASMYRGGEYKEKDSKLRIYAVSDIIRFIEGFNKNKYKILHLQLRAPETGYMIHLSDITNLRKYVNKIFITCHEWVYIKDKDSKSQIDYIKEADHTIFLNEGDKDAAIDTLLSFGFDMTQEEKLKKFSVSCLSSTVKPNAISIQATNRPPNILIFGLIRNNKGFEIIIQVAKKLASLSDLHPLKNIKIICAGKPQDIKLARSLIYETKGIDSSYYKDLSKYITDQRITATDTFKQRKFIEMVLKEVSKEQVLQLRTELPPEFLKMTLDALHKLAIKDIEQHFSTYGWKSFELLERKLKIANLAKVAKSAMDKKITDSERDIFDIGAFMEFVKKNDPNKITGNLPISLHFDVTPNKLDELSAQCKYCIKFENKGFANNSSSIINTLHRRLVIFTNNGSLTSKEFLENGIYNNALALFPEDAKPNKKGMLEDKYIDAIIEKISERETNKDLNAGTVQQIESVVTNLFNINIICTSLLKNYNQHLSNEVSK